jgi:hypothetical protein
MALLTKIAPLERFCPAGAALKPHKGEGVD